MANNETIADIIAEMRGARTEFPFVYLMGEPDMPEVIDFRTKEIIEPRKINIRRVTVKELADRFEVAHKRERGDCAKLREALLQVIRSMELESGHMCTEKKRLGMHGQTQEDLCKGCRARNAECWTMTLKRECEAALAEKPRNCDVYTADELKVIFKSELVSELPIANEHEKNLITITAMRVIDTLFATAEEGGKNAYK